MAGTTPDGFTAKFTCACPAGLSGAGCATNVSDSSSGNLDVCASNPCQNSGVCTALEVPTSFATTDFGNTATCPSGNCVDPQQGYECTCVGGWEGALDGNPGNCDLSRSPCLNDEDDCDPANRGDTASDGSTIHNAECLHTGPATHECICRTGYETSNGGQLCTDIDECMWSPCQNGGVFSSSTGDITGLVPLSQFACACASGYASVECQEDVNECLSSPCQNGAFCTEGVDAYTPLRHRPQLNFSRRIRLRSESRA